MKESPNKSSSGSEISKEAREAVINALEAATKLNTGQGCPDENLSVVVLAGDALDALHALSVKSEQGGYSECCNALLRVESGDEYTSHYTCTKCGCPADPKPATATAPPTREQKHAETGLLCRRCNVPMVIGKATAQTWVMGIPDFPGNDIDSRGQTLNVGGPGRLIDCFKCPQCGHSVTIGQRVPQIQGGDHNANVSGVSERKALRNLVRAVDKGTGSQVVDALDTARRVLSASSVLSAPTEEEAAQPNACGGNPDPVEGATVQGQAALGVLRVYLNAEQSKLSCDSRSHDPSAIQALLAGIEDVERLRTDIVGLSDEMETCHQMLDRFDGEDEQTTCFETLEKRLSVLLARIASLTSTDGPQSTQPASPPKGEEPASPLVSGEPLGKEWTDRGLL